MRTTALVMATLLVAGCKGKTEEAKTTEAKPTAPAAGELTLGIKDKPETKITPQAAFASTTQNPGGFAVYFYGNCPALAQNPCEALKEGRPSFAKLDECPDRREIKVLFGYKDEAAKMNPVPVAEIKPGKYGASSAPIKAGVTSAAPKEGFGTQIHSDDVVEITKVDATQIAGKLTAKNTAGDTVTGAFSATICP